MSNSLTVMLSVGGAVLAAACCIPIFAKGRTGDLKGAMPPIPSGDVSFRLGDESPQLVLALDKEDGILKIWTPHNEVVSVRASSVYVSVEEEYKTVSTKGFNEVVTMRGTTPSGQAVTGIGYGTYHPGSTGSLRTGNWLLRVRALVQPSGSAVPEENHGIVLPARPDKLYPGVISDSASGRWWEIEYQLGNDQKLMAAANPLVQGVWRARDELTRRSRAARAGARPLVSK